MDKAPSQELVHMPPFLADLLSTDVLYRVVFVHHVQAQSIR